MIYDFRKILLTIIIPFLLISLILYLKSAHQANAQTMSNSNYIIQMGNLNSFSGKGSGSGYTLTSTGGQNGAFRFSGPNYRVKLGFQYIYPFTFRFSISSVLIDFGPITPGTPVTRANRLTVSNFSAHGYQVTVSQNHNLRVNRTGQEIPPTACDSGFTCTTSTANVWNTSIAYGFGYNCANAVGTDCASGFTDSTYFKPFVSSPSAVVVMSSTTARANRKADITYKVNVSNIQGAGLYTSILNYIATPTF